VRAKGLVVLPVNTIATAHPMAAKKGLDMKGEEMVNRVIFLLFLTHKMGILLKKP
jgi:hypothetical protein